MRVDIAYHTVNGHTFWTNEEFPEGTDLTAVLDDKRAELAMFVDFVRIPNGGKIADVRVSSIDAVSVSRSAKKSNTL